MKKSFSIMFFLLPVLLFSQQVSPPKYALVIGNSAYSYLMPLANPVNDANDVADVLQGLGFTVDKVINGNLIQMENAVIKLKNSLSTSNKAYGFFFYAGHGVQSNGENFLIPIDADIPTESFLRNRTVSVQELLDELNNARNSLNVVVLDACRDNPFGWARGGGRGLAVISGQPADSIIVYATSAGQRASDGQGRNGLFTSQLLNNLKNTNLEVKEIFNRTGADVSAVSNRQQIPAVYNQFFGTAYLGVTPVITTTPVQPVTTASVQPVPQTPPQEQTANRISVLPVNTGTAITFGVPISASITTKIPSNRYTFTCPLPGSVTVTVTNDGTSSALPNQGADIQWFDAQNTRINGSGGGFTLPYNNSMDFPAGVYYIEINGRPGVGNTGTYSIQVGYFTNVKKPNFTRETAQLLVPGLTVRGQLTSQDKIAVYRYELGQPGRLTINLTNGDSGENGGLNVANIRWLDVDGKELKSDSSWINNQYSSRMDFESGTYFIEITPNGNRTGTYNLRGDLLVAGNNETEPNNSCATAQLLTSGQTVKGFISVQDKIDMYRYELGRPGRLTINLTNGDSGENGGLNVANIRWLDVDGKELKSDSSWINNQYSSHMDFESGTYFIEITPNGNRTGTYNLRGDLLVAGNNETEPNNSRATAQLLTSGQTVKGFISVQDKIDMYRYELGRPGRLTINLTNGDSGENGGLNVANIRWLDVDGKELKSDSSWINNQYSSHMDFESGTYFIEITPNGNRTGTYNLTIMEN